MPFDPMSSPKYSPLALFLVLFAAINLKKLTMTDPKWRHSSQVMVFL